MQGRRDSEGLADRLAPGAHAGWVWRTCPCQTSRRFLHRLHLRRVTLPTASSLSTKPVRPARQQHVQLASIAGRVQPPRMPRAFHALLAPHIQSTLDLAALSTRTIANGSVQPVFGGVSTVVRASRAMLLRVLQDSIVAPVLRPGTDPAFHVL